MVPLSPPPLPITVLPPKTLSFQRPSHRYHPRRSLPISTRPCASLSSTEERVVPILPVLRSHGIPEDACTAILSTWPDRFLRMKPLKNLDPKLQFLRSSVGLSGVEVAELLLANPFILTVRLHPSLSSSFTSLASVLPSKEDLVKVLKSIGCSRPDHVGANLQALRDRHVSDSAIRKILLRYPRSLSRRTEDFAAALETIEKLGLSPTGKSFASAVTVACYVSKDTFSRKLELFKELGWSEDQVSSMYRRRPLTFAFSDATLRKKVGYFKEVLGWGPALLSSNPTIMQMSLEDRIIPRCSVLNVLMMKGLLRKQTRNLRSFKIAEERFFAKYVDKYKVEVPEVLEAYQGNMEFTGWGWLKDELGAKLQALRALGGIPKRVIRRLLPQQQPSSLARAAEEEELLAALEDASKHHLQSYTSNARSARKVELFKELGWSEEQVFSMFKRHPKYLSISDDSLRKKIEYFKEVLGWGPDVLCLDPWIMQMSLEERIIPRCAVLNMLVMKGLLKKKKTWYPLRFRENEKSFFENYVEKYKEEVPEVLEAYRGKIEFKGWGWLKNKWEVKLQALRNHGIPEPAIRKLLLQRPSARTKSVEELFTVLENHGRLRLANMSKAKFAGRVKLLKEMGWSEKQVFSMFRRQPKNLSFSPAILKKKVEYFNKVLGWGPDIICSDPEIMQLSLEETIIPRCAVLDVLMMKGMLEKRTSSLSKFMMSEGSFFKSYVESYKEVPEVLEAYQGKIKFTEWGWLMDEKKH